MDTLATSREEGLRRALMLAIPVGTQLGTVGIESLGRAADGTFRLASWGVASAVRTAGASAAFVSRNVLAPLSSFAFGSSQPSTGSIHFSTQSCPQLLSPEGRKHHSSRSQIRFQRVANNLRTGSAKCSIRRSQLSAVSSPSSLSARQADLLAHLAASCALLPSGDLNDDHGHNVPSSEDGAVTEWTVNALGLQSSML